jgi:hypothetical protein
VSYDLNFWKYKPGVSLDHQAVYEQLSEGEEVDGLEDLPIEELVARIGEVFSGWEQLDPLNYESPDGGAFPLFTTRQFLRVDCYGMVGEDMNQFVDIGSAFGCPLYDPQVGQRFDGG